MAKPLRGIVALIIGALPVIVVPAQATGQTTARVVRITEASAWDVPSPDPSGITYDAGRGKLLIADSEVEETPHWEGSNVWFVRVDGEPGRSWSTTDRSSEPTGIASIGQSTLWFVDDDLVRLLRWRPGPNGRWGTPDDRVKSFPTRSFGSSDPEGLALGAGEMFVTDGRDARLYRLSPGDNGRFDGVPPRGDDEVTSFDAAALGLSDPEGVAYDGASGTLLLVSRREKVIVRATLDGSLVETIDISASGILRPSDITLAPGSDDDSEVHVFVTDRGRDNNRHHPDENDGRIFEFALDP